MRCTFLLSYTFVDYYNYTAVRLNGMALHSKPISELPYGITQCYLPPDTGEPAPPSPQPDRTVLDLPAPKGLQAELALALIIYRDIY